MSKPKAVFYASVAAPFLSGGLALCWALAFGWGFNATNLWEWFGTFLVWIIPLCITLLGVVFLGHAYANWVGLEVPEI